MLSGEFVCLTASDLLILPKHHSVEWNQSSSPDHNGQVGEWLLVRVTNDLTASARGVDGQPKRSARPDARGSSVESGHEARRP